MAAASRETPEYSGRNKVATQPDSDQDPENLIYKVLDRSFRKLAIPVALISIVLLIDLFANGNIEYTRIIGYYQPIRGTAAEVLETENGLLYRGEEESVIRVKAGDSLIIERSLILGIIMRYGDRYPRYRPAQSFHEYSVLSVILLFLSTGMLLFKNLDRRLLSGAFSLIILTVLVIVYSVLA